MKRVKRCCESRSTTIHRSSYSSSKGCWQCRGCTSSSTCCIRSVGPHQRRPILRVDLTGVTFIDDAGKACLAAMHRQGAEFVAADCVMEDVVAEIRPVLGRNSTRLSRRGAVPPVTHDDMGVRFPLALLRLDTGAQLCRPKIATILKILTSRLRNLASPSPTRTSRQRRTVRRLSTSTRWCTPTRRPRRRTVRLVPRSPHLPSPCRLCTATASGCC